MSNISLTDILAKMPVDELEQTLQDFLEPMSELLPEERLRLIEPLAVRGILAQETPVIAAMAQSVSRQEMDYWAAAIGLKPDQDSPYILLRGLSAVCQCVATLSWIAFRPFPNRLFQAT